MDTTKVALPRLVYEAIEDVLEAQIRRLAIDIAKTLDVNEKILLQELKKDKISVLILDEADAEDIHEYRCKAYEKQSNIYTMCEEPIVYKKNFCVKHLINHTLKKDVQMNEVLHILCLDSIKYYRDKNNKVYNSEFNMIGFYNPSTQTIVEFVEETSSS
jgi:hypothetical protein